ncbi:MAG: alpha/beta hydrolase [Candidatus Krumholzibacteriia bacterium]
MARIYFATNRDPEPPDAPRTFGGHFNPAAFDNLRFGRATVVGKQVREVTVADETLSADHARARLGSQEIFGELLAAMRRGADTLVYVHGYNVSFTDALRGGGAIRRALRTSRGLNVVVFSWPSDGSMLPFLAYKHDRSDARASAAAFARALLKLEAFLVKVRRGAECGARLHLLCHSMGNYVLRYGIQEVRRQTGGLPRLFDTILLMAADEDYDAFELDFKLAPLPEMGESVNVYFNSGDTALVISDRTKANPARLGSRGPRSPLTVPGNVTLVDASEVVGGLVEHSYFVDEPVVVRDLRAVLAGKAADRIAHRRYVAAQNRYVLSK